jgi:hypothetical protein
MSEEQHEQRVLNAGWTQWTDELADGRKVKLPFWKYEGGFQWYFNDSKQSEYINTERRYTLAQAVDICKRLEKTQVLLAERRAEAEKTQRISGQQKPPLSAAEAAAQAAAAEEASVSA